MNMDIYLYIYIIYIIYTLFYLYTNTIWQSVYYTYYIYVYIISSKECCYKNNNGNGIATMIVSFVIDHFLFYFSFVLV